VAASRRHLACREVAVRVGMAESPRKSRPGELHRRRVLLLAESAGLVAMLGHVLGPADRLSRLDSLYDVARSRLLEAADVVVLDLPGRHRASAVRLVRRRYRGPLVVLAGEGEDPTGSEGLDDACILLARPFSVEGLRAAMAGRGLPPPPRVVPPAVPAAASSAALPRRPDLADRAQGLLVALVESWQARRQVRVAGFAALAVVAFAVAFALAANDRCGAGCDPLGTGLSPAPTIASVESRAPSASAPEHPTSTTIIRAGTPGAGAFLGTSGRRRVTTTSERSAASTTQEATTTRRPATTRPATTRPATTQSTAPPTTVPTTTAPPSGQGTPGPTPTTAAT
jgi:hypothetical protein